MFSLRYDCKQKQEKHSFSTKEREVTIMLEMLMEMFMDPLGALVITFFVMSIISILAVVLLHTLKNEKFKKIILYFLSVWSIIIAYCGILSTPFYMSGERFITVAIGALAVVGILVWKLSKKENKFKIASILVSVSVVAGMVDCFLW